MPLGKEIPEQSHRQPSDSFGADLPIYDPNLQLSWAAYSEISVEDKEKILGKNMEWIINRVEFA